MKKLIAGILVLVLALSVAAGCLADSSDSSAIRFDPKLAAALEWDADKIMSSGQNRAMVTVLLWLQLSIDGTFSSDDYTLVDSMIGRKDDIITVGLLSETKKNTLVIIYAPKSQYGSYLTIDLTDRSLVKTVLQNTNDKVYDNDLSDLKTALETLQTLLKDNK